MEYAANNRNHTLLPNRPRKEVAGNICLLMKVKSLDQGTQCQWSIFHSTNRRVPIRNHHCPSVTCHKLLQIKTDNLCLWTKRQDENMPCSSVNYPPEEKTTDLGGQQSCERRVTRWRTWCWRMQWADAFSLDCTSRGKASHTTACSSLRWDTFRSRKGKKKRFSHIFQTNQPKKRINFGEILNRTNSRGRPWRGRTCGKCSRQRFRSSIAPGAASSPPGTPARSSMTMTTPVRPRPH